MNEQIACGSVLVRPGDIVGCDGDGCLVVSHELVHDVIEATEALYADV